MSSRIQLYCLIGILSLVGILGLIYKRAVVGYPFVPSQRVPVWSIEANISFKAHGDPVKVSMAVPGEQNSIGLLKEEGISLGYGYTPAHDDNANALHRRAIWARNRADGKQRIYYRILAYQKFQPQHLGPLLTDAPTPDPRYGEEPLRTAVLGLVAEAREHSAGPESLTSFIIGKLSSADPGQNARYILQEAQTPLQRAVALQQVLIAAEVEAHLIKGLHLAESRKRQPLTPAVLIRTGEDSWQAFLANKPQPGIPTPFLAWQRGGESLIDVTGGSGATVTFSVLRDLRPINDVIHDSSQRLGRRLAEFSIYNLPIDQQNAFRMLLMVPLGALVIVILRNLVGLKTSGTFMPILLAMSFLQTELLPGITIFLLVVGAGLIVRSYLSRLDLLLVPRISAVVVVVIGIMAFASILGHLLRLDFARSLTLFPTIILAWTVERLSVLWEEDGGREVAIQTGGSLVAAFLCYLVMGNDTLKYLVFTFPEWILIVLSIILLLGQYTGYRLSELRRFSPLAKGEQ